MLVAANQVPLWAALLIGLGGGVIGTLIAQGLERGAEMRTRMLQAADDYLSAAIAAERAAEDLNKALRATPRPAADKLDELLARIQASRDEMSEMIPRLMLLFGVYSATGVEAVSVNFAWKVVADHLKMRVEGHPWLDAERFDKDWYIASGAITTFGEAARRDVRFGVASRWALRLRNLR